MLAFKKKVAKKQMMVYLPVALIKSLKLLAKKNGVTHSEFFMTLIDHALKDLK